MAQDTIPVRVVEDSALEAEAAARALAPTFDVRIFAGPPLDDGATQRPGATARLPKPSIGPTTPGARVLVVDDKVDAAELLGAALALHGLDVRIATDGPRALEVATSFQPKVVLLDIGLPDMDGYEVARNLRADPRHRETFIVALTGYGANDDRERSRSAGMDEHLVKPIALGQLTALLIERLARTA